MDNNTNKLIDSLNKICTINGKKINIDGRYYLNFNYGKIDDKKITVIKVKESEGIFDLTNKFIINDSNDYKYYIIYNNDFINNIDFSVYNKCMSNLYLLFTYDMPVTTDNLLNYINLYFNNIEFFNNYNYSNDYNDDFFNYDYNDFYKYYLNKYTDNKDYTDNINLLYNYINIDNDEYLKKNNLLQTKNYIIKIIKSNSNNLILYFTSYITQFYKNSDNINSDNINSDNINYYNLNTNEECIIMLLKNVGINSNNNYELWLHFINNFDKCSYPYCTTNKEFKLDNLMKELHNIIIKLDIQIPLYLLDDARIKNSNNKNFLELKLFKENRDKIIENYNIISIYYKYGAKIDNNNKNISDLTYLLKTLDYNKNTNLIIDNEQNIKAFTFIKKYYDRMVIMPKDFIMLSEHYNKKCKGKDTIYGGSNKYIYKYNKYKLKYSLLK